MQNFLLILLLTISIKLQIANAGLNSEDSIILDNLPSTCINSISKFTGNAENFRKMIHGPANYRDKPNGKIIGMFPNKFIVLAEKQNGDWFYIRGYWERECDAGWTHKKNLLSITRAQIESMNKLGYELITNLKNLTSKAFKLYFTNSKNQSELFTLIDKGLRQSSNCRNEKAIAECANATHLLNLLKARIAIDTNNLERASKALIESANIPPVFPFTTFGPNTTIAKLLLEKGQTKAVIQFLELTKKFWTNTPEKHPNDNGYTAIPKKCELPDTWISEIQAGKIPQMNEIENLTWVWKKEGWNN